jgi:uncharacterized RDD family membrane protein YckC
MTKPDTTIDGYVGAVERHLPRWLGWRSAVLSELRSHLEDRVAAGESAGLVVSRMEAPEEYAAALVGDVPLESAPLARRLGAFLVDVVLGLPVLLVSVFGSLWLTGALMPTLPPDLATLWLQSLGDLLAVSAWMLLALLLGLVAGSALVLSLVYFPVAEAVWGTTIGKHLLGLCVVTENGTRVTWGKALIRRIPFYFEFFFLDAIFALFTKRRQRAFDHVARTVVVRRPDAAAAATA